MFTNKTLAFLRALKKNNDRAWFHARRAEYEQHVRGPMIDIVDQLAHDFRTLAPELIADPKVSLFRPWRDTRFSEDKAPLKTNVAAGFPNRRLGRMNGAGLYFEVATTWVWIGGGMYAPDSPQLHAIREHIVANQRRFQRVVGAPAFNRLGGLKGDRLSRVPRGLPKDHPGGRLPDAQAVPRLSRGAAAFATRPDFYKQLLATFKALVPLVPFLNEPLVERRERSKSARTSSTRTSHAVDAVACARPRHEQRRPPASAAAPASSCWRGRAGENAERHDRRQHRDDRAERDRELRRAHLLVRLRGGAGPAWRCTPRGTSPAARRRSRRPAEHERAGQRERQRDRPR